MNLFVRLWIVLLVLSPVAMAKPAQLNLADINGKEHTLADYKGKWVVVNYWATWCPPCLREIPELNKLHEKGKKNNVAVLGVNFEEATESHIKKFIDKYSIAYPVLLEEESAVSQLGPIEGLPKTFFISPSGELVHQKIGIVTLEILEDTLLQLKKAQ